MKYKVVSWVNFAFLLLWITSCTVAHSKMIECTDTCNEDACRQMDTCPGRQDRPVTIPVAPAAPQAPSEHDCCMCEHHARCTDFVPESFRNAGGGQQPTAASTHAAAGFLVTATCVHLPEHHAFAAAARVRLTCLRTTVLRI